MSADLFTYQNPVGRDHPRTSYQAADAIAPVTGKLQQAVYAFAVERGDYGFTDAEMYERFSDNLENNLRPRRIELVAARWLKDSGKRRPNRRGRACVVWVVT
jgi:DNA-binding LytR/AlgR family response regulator